MNGNRLNFVVLCGPSHSGKSHFASQYLDTCEIISSDEIRKKLFGTYELQDKSEEALVWLEFDRRKQEAFKNNRNIILDACHMSPGSRFYSTRDVPLFYCRNIVIFHPALKIIMKRVKRTGRIPPDIARNMYKNFILPGEEEVKGLGIVFTLVIRK